MNNASTLVFLGWSTGILCHNFPLPPLIPKRPKYNIMYCGREGGSFWGHWTTAGLADRAYAHGSSLLNTPRLCTTDLYLEGQGDLVSRLIMGINRVTIWVTGVINLLTKSP